MQRRTQRFIFFSLAILVGLAAGIFFGWQVAPARYTDTSPDTLRQDYQTDFILMVAELYGYDADLAMATSRLTYLNPMSPLDTIQAAIAYAQKNNYTIDDLQLMFNLEEMIRNLTLNSEQGRVD